MQKSKKKAGRPPKTDETRKTRLLHVRFTPPEMERIKGKAEEAGKTMTEYVRAKLLRR